nr:type I restriction-modification system subunit M N-terminal domain-containing protein [uncultured Deefgea sp.]
MVTCRLTAGDFKQSQYGRIILPFTLLRRLECVLAETKEAVLKQVEIVELMNLPEEGQENLPQTDNKAFNAFYGIASTKC